MGALALTVQAVIIGEFAASRPLTVGSAYCMGRGSVAPKSLLQSTATNTVNKFSGGSWSGLDPPRVEKSGG